MVFTLSFKRKDESGYPLYVPSHDIGATGVTRIREELGCNVPIDRINPEVRFFSSYGRIEVPEDYAFKAGGRFAFKNSVQVKVPEGMMNQFTGERVCATRHVDTGEVLESWIETYIREDAVLAAWEMSGYPTDWSLDALTA